MSGSNERYCADAVQSQGKRVRIVKQTGFQKNQKTATKGVQVTFRQTVPDTSSGDRKSSVADGRQSGAADHQ